MYTIPRFQWQKLIARNDRICNAGRIPLCLIVASIEISIPVQSTIQHPSWYFSSKLVVDLRITVKIVKETLASTPFLQEHFCALRETQIASELSRSASLRRKHH